MATTKPTTARRPLLLLLTLAMAFASLAPAGIGGVGLIGDADRASASACQPGERQTFNHSLQRVQCTKMGIGACKVKVLVGFKRPGVAIYETKVYTCYRPIPGTTYTP